MRCSTSLANANAQTSWTHQARMKCGSRAMSAKVSPGEEKTPMTRASDDMVRVEAAEGGESGAAVLMARDFMPEKASGAAEAAPEGRRDSRLRCLEVEAEHQLDQTASGILGGGEVRVGAGDAHEGSGAQIAARRR